MGGRIDCCIDIASAFSYLAFVNLRNNRELLESHNVHLEFHPFFLGGVMSASNNQPPWMVQAKGRYLKYDLPRAAASAGRPEMRFPRDFLSYALTTLPLRALHFIKTTYPERYEHAMMYFFEQFWTPPNLNLSQMGVFSKVLAETPSIAGGAGETMFSAGEVKAILEGAQSQECKDMLNKTTAEAVERGAFGAPYFWVTNAEGKGEPFFGNDRFHHVFEFLGLPYQDVKLLPAVQGSEATAKAKI